MAYVRLGTQYLDLRRFRVLPSHGRASKIDYAGRFRATMYGAWRMRQDKWGTVKKHAEEEMDILVLRDVCEAAYVTRLAKFVQD